MTEEDKSKIEFEVILFAHENNSHRVFINVRVIDQNGNTLQQNSTSLSQGDTLEVLGLHIAKKENDGE